MPNSQDWCCIYTSESLIEANLIRSYLERKGIPVAIYSLPMPQLHNYLHDKNERVRIFVQATNLAEIKESIHQMVLANRMEYTLSEVSL